jgi:hypothetical protein
MNPKLKEKLELTMIGYGFVGLNLYATHVGRPLFGLGFGCVALIFFIKSLRIKNE